MRLRFALLSEGTSERGLVPHLEELCVRFGADEAAGSAPDLGRLRPSPGHELAPRLRALLAVEPDIHFVVVHRDADRAGVEARRREMAEAAAAIGLAIPFVPLVPVTMLEAWLLLDADAIRAAVGRPRGRGEVDLPKPRAIEGLADPKKRLREVLTATSGASGSRLRALNTPAAFASNRHFLVERLDLDGPINTLRAWQALLTDLRATLADLGVTG